MIKYKKTLDAKDLTKKYRDRIVHYREQFDLFQECVAVLRKFDGKKVTKRIVTAMGKELGVHVYLDKSFILTIRLVVSRRLASWSLNLYIKADDTFSFDDFLDNNKGYSNLKQTADAIEGNLSKLPRLVAQYNKMLLEAQRVSGVANDLGFGSDFDVSHT